MAVQTGQKKYNLFRNIAELINFYRSIEVRLNHFVLAVALSFIAILFHVIGFRLMIGLLKGIIEQDFSFIRHSPRFKHLFGPLLNIFSDSSPFILIIGIILFLAITKNILRYCASLSISCQVRHAKKGLRKLIFDRYLLFGKSFYDQTSIGKLSSKIVQSSQAIASQLSALHRILSQLFSTAAYIIIMFAISWQLTLLTLLIFPAFIIPVQGIVKKIRSLSKTQVDSEEHLDKKIFNVLSSILLVKVQGMEAEEKIRFAKVNEEEIELGHQIDRKEKLIEPIRDITMLAAFLLVTIALRSVAPSKGGGDIAIYILFFYLVRLSLPGFGAVSQFRMTIAKSNARIDKLFDLLKKGEASIVPSGEREFSGLKESIEFKRLSFSYRRPKREIISDISLSFKKGEMTAIVGPTGTGKTTLVHLLLRFYDCPPGTITLDGIDIRDFRLKTLSDYIAYAGQDTLLFDDTLKANMLYGLDDKVTDKMLIDVARKTRLYNSIMRLPEKWDTPIGDRGVQLSRGQRQRLAIARALLKGANVLILDEATNSLDPKTEDLIRDAIDEAVKGRTTIVIAHRLSTIRHADKIIVIDNGRVEEQGKLDELLDKKGKFYELWGEQKFY